MTTRTSKKKLLSTPSLLTAAVVAIAILLALFFAATIITKGLHASSKALAASAANSGAEDALLKLDRNAALSYPYPASGYTIDVGTTTATVYVTQGSPSGGDVTVLSVSMVSGATAKVQAILAKDPLTERTSIVSWQEIQ